MYFIIKVCFQAEFKWWREIHKHVVLGKLFQKKYSVKEKIKMVMKCMLNLVSLMEQKYLQW